MLIGSVCILDLKPSPRLALERRVAHGSYKRICAASPHRRRRYGEPPIPPLVCLPCVKMIPFASAAAQPQIQRKAKSKGMYHTTDEPISSFGFATNFEQLFDTFEPLGHGTFGTVYRAVRKSDGEEFAVKRMPKRFKSTGILDKNYVRRIRNEVEIGSHLGASLSIAYLYGAYENEKEVDLVFELCTGGELWSRIQRLGAYTERDAARLVRGVLRTVAQCHAAGVLIRDVKPENFLFASPDPDAALKAIDFGISVFCEPGQVIELRAGTPVYIAPEVLRQRYSLPADVWSAGIVAYQLLTGRLPFGGEYTSVAETYMKSGTADNKEMFRAVLYANLDFESSPWDILTPEAKDLVSSMLNRNPDERPTAEEALQHPWLAEPEHVASDVPLGDTIIQRLQRFGTYGRLKQAALRKIAHAAMTSSSSSDGRGTLDDSRSPSFIGSLPRPLREAFAKHDVEGTGRVNIASLKQELSNGHFRLTDAEVEQMCAQLSADSKDMVDWESWVAAMSDWHYVRSSSDWDSLVEEAFLSLDMDRDEALGVSDLADLLCSENGCLAADEVEAALREADTDRDGKLTLRDFQNMLAAYGGDLTLFDSRVVNSDDE